MKRILCKIEKCLACRSCELACAAAHTVSKVLAQAILKGEIPRPRVHVQSIDDAGTLHRARAIAVRCRYCEEPACAAACISGAIRRNNENGEILINLERCVGCWSCIMVCSIGAITRSEETHRILKCDHCPDLETPACVTACPTSALILAEQAATEDT
jgi:anaerobic carbon-monoxide dehydrogenase iron sulfur subunit